MFYNIGPRALYYKQCQQFTNFRNKLMFVDGNLFQPSLTNTLAQYENF
jgi:hypothetical protein